MGMFSVWPNWTAALVPIISLSLTGIYGSSTWLLASAWAWMVGGAGMKDELSLGLKTTGPWAEQGKLGTGAGYK